MRSKGSSREKQKGSRAIANVDSSASENNQTAQLEAPNENTTGLPDHLKSGVENLSGHSFDDVNVNYNSSKPAAIGALAYAQGNQIHLGPGQEQHLPHEAWHVVQQKQGRVKPTMQMKGGVSINDDDGLEKEADLMGAKAIQMVAEKSVQRKERSSLSSNSSIQAKLILRNGERVEVADNYILQAGERPAAIPGEFDSLDMSIVGGGEASRKPANPRFGRRARNAIAGSATEDIYNPDKQDELRDNVVDSANRDGMTGRLRRWAQDAANPRIGAMVEHQRAKVALEQEQHERMISRAKAGRERTEREQLAGNVLKVVGTAGEFVPGLSRAASGGRAVASAFEASGYDDQASARETVGKYAVGEGSEVHRARASEMRARRNGALVDSAGHATSTLVGGGGGLVSMGGRKLAGIDSDIEDSQRRAGRAIYHNDALDKFMYERRIVEERKRRVEESGGFDSF